MCSEAKVESQRLRTGKLAQDDWPRLTAACDKLMKAPIYVDDTGSITMMELRSKARRLKSREPKLGLIIVDYLQLMTSGSNRREPGAGGLADLALAEGARARPRGADHRPLAALARGRAAPRQAPDPLRPARVRARSSRTPTSSRSSTATSTTTARSPTSRGSPRSSSPSTATARPTSVKLRFLKRYAKFTDLAAASQGERGRRRTAADDGADDLGLPARDRVHGGVRGVRRAAARG